MIDPNKFSSDFIVHVATLAGTQIVADELTALESWFRVEIPSMLIGNGLSREMLLFNYKYPLNPKSKADLCLHNQIVFELKCFSRTGDSNKKNAYPGQIAMLRDHVIRKQICQAICFTTFAGYKDTNLKKMIVQFWPAANGWTHSGPHDLLPGSRLKFLVSEFHV